MPEVRATVGLDYISCPTSRNLQVWPDSAYPFILAMQRFTARLVLLFFALGTCAPFLQALSAASLHACCLRAGLHHCQGSSSETGFHAPRANCPHSTPITLTAFNGLESAKFNLSTPAISGFVALTPLDRAYGVNAHNRGARGPPLFR